MDNDVPAEASWIALRGIIAIVFGALTLILPAISLDLLVLLFGAYALFEGGFNFIAGVQSLGENPWWWSRLLGGLVGLGMGIVAFSLPGLTELALLYVYLVS